MAVSPAASQTGQDLSVGVPPRRRAIRDLRGAWHRACKAASVPGRLLHDFRRTAVRNLDRAAVPRSVAMRITGHKTESVYQRYSIVAEADLRDGLGKLAAAVGTKKGTVRPISGFELGETT